MTAIPARRQAAFAFAAIALLGSLSACSDDTEPEDKTAEGDVTAYAVEHCEAGTSCTSPEVKLGDTTLQVTADASEFSQTVSVELVDDQTLECSATDAVTGGAMAIFSNTAPDAKKTITYKLTGDAAATAKAAFEDHPEYLGCYGAPQTFTGFVGEDSGRAAYDSETRTYVAALLPCEKADSNPCLRFEESDGTVTITVEAPAGDPKLM